ncbi:MAG: diguanylate cyclase, partial [Desulfobacteraceae bacterium]
MFRIFSLNRSDREPRPDREKLNLKFYSLILAGCWTLIIVLSLWWNIAQQKRSVLESAYSTIRSHMQKDLILREWNMSHGFVYAPVTEGHPPNHYLQLPERDITTPRGKNLTAINSSTMIRQIYELSRQKLQIKGHLTGLRPLNPGNTPDPWEIRALNGLAQDKQEFSEKMDWQGQPTIRLMTSLVAQKSCLKCHEGKGFREGEVLGGLSISLPTTPLWAVVRLQTRALGWGHGLLWLLGLIGIFFGDRTLQNRIQARQEAEAALQREQALLSAINRVFQEAITSETEKELALTCLQVSEELTRSRFGWIGEINSGGRLDTLALSNPGWEACTMPRSESPRLIMDMAIRGIWGKVLQDGKSVITNKPDGHPDRVGLPPGHPALFAFLGVPLTYDGRVAGMIALANKSGGYDLQDQKAMESLSVAIGEALFRKRSNQALKKSEENYRLLVSNIPAVVYRGFADGAINFPDEKIIKLTGYSREAFNSRQVTWLDLILEQDLPLAREAIIQALKTNRSFRREYRIKTRSGKIIVIQDRGQIILKADGTIDLISGVVFDITRQKLTEEALQQSERHWKTMLEAVGVGIVLVEAESHRIVEVNPKAVDLIGCGRDQIIGQHCSRFFCPPESNLCPVTAAGQMENQVERILTTAKGEQLPILKTVVPILREEKRFFLESFVDLSEQREAEKALSQVNARLQETVAEMMIKNRDMRLLRNLNELFQVCRFPDEAYPIIAQFMQDFFPESSGALFMQSPAENLMEIKICWGKAPIKATVFPPEECWGLRRGRSHYWDAGATPGAKLNCRHAADHKEGASLCIPLNAQGETLGLLYFQISPGASMTEDDFFVEYGAAFNEAQIQLAESIAEHVSLSLVNLKLRETLQQQAIRDPLTGLFNRRYLQETLDRELHRADRQGKSLGVMMLDLDHFKQFNDTYGHDLGDLILKKTGAFLKNGIRSEDIACRFGGEEFTLILPEASPEILEKRAESLRAGIEQLQVPSGGKMIGG